MAALLLRREASRNEMQKCWRRGAARSLRLLAYQAHVARLAGVSGSAIIVSAGGAQYMVARVAYIVPLYKFCEGPSITGIYGK